MSRKTLYSLLGVLAILCWSSTFAFSRPLAEKLGIVRMVAYIFTIGGLFGVFSVLVQPAKRSGLVHLNKRYLIVCGLIFFVHISCMYTAIGLAQTRQQIIAVGLINYLWPGLTILFSIPILKQRAKPVLVIGLLTATIGVFLSGIQGDTETWRQLFLTGWQQNWPAFSFSFAGAVLWALFTNFSRKLGGASGSEAMAFFILIVGLVFLIISLFISDVPDLNGRTIFELLYMAVVATFLGYLFWDIAVKKGDVVFVASISYITPLLATLWSCLYLEITCGWVLWLAAFLVIIGSVICKLSLYPQEYHLN